MVAHRFFSLKKFISLGYLCRTEIINILVGVLLFVTAFVLYLPTRNQSDNTLVEDNTRIPSNKEAVVTGLVQGFSVLPGLSRSGVTVSALLIQKVDKETALRFSFLMSVPAVLGILVVEILTGGAVIPTINPIDLLLMEIIVFVTGIASIEILLRLARKISFWKLCLILATIAILFGIPALI